MLKSACDFVANETVALIPNSGIQFLDLAFSAQDAKKNGQQVQAVKSATDTSAWHIFPTVTAEDGQSVFTTPAHLALAPADEGDCYTISGEAALSAYDDQWLPFPFFRRRGENFDQGPTTWARIKVIRLAAPDQNGQTHRLILAFDTLLTPRLDGQPYATPEYMADATDKVLFGFSASHDHNHTFMGHPWVRGWLQDQYHLGLEDSRGKKIPKEFLKPGEAIAAYMSLLNVISASCRIPNVELVDIFTEYGNAQPVGVNLVLDIGNSRMCGVLVEDGSSEGYADIGQIYRLELRDLSRVEQTYSDPFESRIEFAAADFGPVRYSTASGRIGQEAFWWPSPVRVGPEAARLASKTDGTEGRSGLSSPKRYLWDNSARPQPWVNNNACLPLGAEAQEIRGPMVSRLTEDGDLVAKRKGAFPGLMRRYSRSSLYTLMLAELLIHALSQINSVAVRRDQANSSAPRTLKQITLTLPTATPVAEQRAMRERISAAIDLVWDVMGWAKDKEGAGKLYDRPQIRLDWDEATCTHLVYLYNELKDRFHGTPREFFELMSRSDERRAENAGLRIASIDIGGGTTDLMVIDHKIRKGTDTVIEPQQVFREGFRQAGDDIVKQLIEQFMLPAMTNWLRDAGIDRADLKVAATFGGNREAMGQRERTMRAQFVSLLLAPATVGLLKLYEQGKIDEDDTVVLRDLLPANLPLAMTAIDWANEQLGLGGNSILDCRITFSVQRFEEVIVALMMPMLQDIGDLVRAHDCDVLLISGRPSQFPILKRLIFAGMPVPANRIIAMGEYRVGNWYPFRSDDFLIHDPKTTAVVGAMLCHVCSRSIDNMTLSVDNLKMRSTARVIGVMDDNGHIPANKVLLHNIDLDNDTSDGEFVLHLASPCFIGFRQLSLARWRSSPLYYLRFSKPENLGKLNLPLSVTFRRRDTSGNGDEFAMEDFVIVDVTDAEGMPQQPNVVNMRLQTMVIDNQSEAGYWLDTGVLNVAQI